MKKKNLIILISTAVFLLLISVFFVSYGYITNGIIGNETSKGYLFKRNLLKIEYSGGNETIDSEQNDFYSRNYYI